MRTRLKTKTTMVRAMRARRARTRTRMPPPRCLQRLPRSSLRLLSLMTRTRASLLVGMMRRIKPFDDYPSFSPRSGAR